MLELFFNVVVCLWSYAFHLDSSYYPLLPTSTPNFDIIYKHVTLSTHLGITLRASLYVTPVQSHFLRTAQLCIKRGIFGHTIVCIGAIMHPKKKLYAYIVLFMKKCYNR